MRGKITVDSDDLLRRLEKASSEAPEAITKTVTACVLQLAGESARRAPIESGDLRNNCVAKVENMIVFQKQSPSGGRPTPQSAVVGSVGYSLPYARRQHEDLTMRHDRTDGYRIRSGKNAGRTVNMVAGGEAKFLERPFLELKPKFMTAFEKMLEGLLK